MQGGNAASPTPPVTRGYRFRLEAVVCAHAGETPAADDLR